MVSKVIVIPESVRGGGNIVSPHDSSDYMCFDSVVSSSSDLVHGVTSTVYQIVYDGTTFLLSVTSQIVKSGSTVTVSVLLTDEDGEPIEDASIGLYKVT